MPCPVRSPHSADDYITYFTDAGFVVAEYYSCGLDWACGIKGDEDFLEMLKIAASMRDSANENVDFNYGISASGHSSGARAALMIAAARDTDDYLPDRIKDDGSFGSWTEAYGTCR